MDNITAISISTAMLKSSHLQEQLALKLIESASLKSSAAATVQGLSIEKTPAIDEQRIDIRV